jgi:hypothetical protein
MSLLGIVLALLGFYGLAGAAVAVWAWRTGSEWLLAAFVGLVWPIQLRHEFIMWRQHRKETRR